jgi:hypothetical protein
MTEDQAEEMIAGFVSLAWKEWCRGGGLEAVEATLGPVKTDPWLRVFEAGWKLGAEATLRSGKALAESLEGGR